jgi:hypothetical protein
MTRGFVYDFDSWGKPYWQVMHAVTFLYPETPTEDDKQRALVFFRLVPFLLPCSICGLHFVKTLQTMPLDDAVLASRDTLSRWLVDVHNNVNERLKHEVVPYEKVKDYYLNNAAVPLRESEVIKPPREIYKMPFFGVLCALGVAVVLFLAFVIFVKKTKKDIRQ